MQEHYEMCGCLFDFFYIKLMISKTLFVQVTQVLHIPIISNIPFLLLMSAMNKKQLVIWHWMTDWAQRNHQRPSGYKCSCSYCCNYMVLYEQIFHIRSAAFLPSIAVQEVLCVCMCEANQNSQGKAELKSKPIKVSPNFSPLIWLYCRGSL